MCVCVCACACAPDHSSSGTGPRLTPRARHTGGPAPRPGRSPERRNSLSADRMPLVPSSTRAVEGGGGRSTRAMDLRLILAGARGHDLQCGPFPGDLTDAASTVMGLMMLGAAADSGLLRDPKTLGICESERPRSALARARALTTRTSACADGLCRRRCADVHHPSPSPAEGVGTRSQSTVEALTSCPCPCLAGNSSAES